MFVEPTYQASIKEFIYWCFHSPAAAELSVIKLAGRISETALSSLGESAVSHTELSIQSALSFVGLEFLNLGADIKVRHKEVKQEILAEYHQTMVPALDPDLRSFTFEMAQSVIEGLAGQMKLSAFQGVRLDADEYCEFTIKTPLDGNSGHSVALQISCRLSAIPKISDKILISDPDGHAAQFSLAQMLGNGFWRPCLKNTKATEQELEQTLYEPIFLYSRLLEQLQRS